ncbi:type II secretion system minor pseudopilin GspK [Glaciimonas sp. PCH181]|uniref:type II secretion system minor pseudopilin GspK n=1 Tax=Glaciimonas sp. PCH181 TaxID=2133943 RepID=UPI001CED0D05|nr:type II secretion system minor pseudopilin GspK [Glaciimonas sp. PCH181]
MTKLLPSQFSARQLSRQHGVAIVTALLLTALAVTLVSSLFWQQQVQVRSIENQRLQLQKDWILRGALDWAATILRVSASGSNVDYLGQSWSLPLAETRLDSYVDGAQASGGSANDNEVILSGRIVDAQSRYNLTNLSSNGAVNPIELATFKRLLINLHLSPDLGDTVAAAVAATQVSKAPQNQAASTDTNVALPLLHTEDLLALPGISPAILRSLQDFVVVLPIMTPINLNTTSAAVLNASFEGLSPSDAASLIASRTAAYFRDGADFSTRLPGNTAISATSNPEPVGFSSSFFLVYGNVRMGRATSDTVSLIKREFNHTSVLWTKEH